ncbi:MAG TPA: ATP/GTP-binding protein [Caldisericia bacterium]|nr:ATP/GTP-binding protein [Caldisericia bacterium]HPF49023.1 ATP/GTP-binding protein [Caldisericia bacterium]HPI83113.1 ATP/GTP-binding protein [Caldisericia bacterium]HPQ92340.1 ATP/GTP-binding protein [Caldisericia bacterium]HRV74562.1 ATP/GTP-binding protein [Caldisericia bacterium]
MRRVKVLVTGPFASGKTSFISKISEIPVVSTEKSLTDETRVVKEKTTVALDFGRITIDEDLVLYIFGTPGQERFSYMWDVLSVGAYGLVVTVDSTDYRSIIQGRRYLAFFLPKLKIPCIIAANKQDLPNALKPDEISTLLGIDPSIEVLPCTTTEGDSVKKVLLRLFETIDELGIVGDYTNEN